MSFLHQTFTPPGASPSSVHIMQLPDLFDLTLKYKQAGGIYATVTSALGDISAIKAPGTHTAHWENPGQDRGFVEISDAQMQLEAEPNIDNEVTYELVVASVQQMTVADAIGSIGDVKVNFTLE